MKAGIFRPLGERVFRRIWLTSVLSNLGQLVGTVGAAWAMTQLTDDSKMVALVQTATMLPMMLGAIPAGAIADMFDRRKVAIAGLSISFVSAGTLWLLALSGMATPTVLLSFAFLIGCGIALFGPAWQSSVVEQVPREVMAEAIALTSISYNIARSFGPAIGGAVVAAAGASAAFLTNTLFYVPLIFVLLFWRRVQQVPHLPPERVDRAIVSGVRYVFHAPPIRLVMVRTLILGGTGASLSALMPLIARDLLTGGPSMYGIILGALGAGAIIGALVVSTVRERLSGENGIRLCATILGVAIIVVAFSRSPFITVPAIVVAGIGWMLSIAMFNISVQTSAPRWVTGRVLAIFQASITGGIALGSWMWGEIADAASLTTALAVSGAAVLVTIVVGFWLRMPDPGAPMEEEMIVREEPQVALALTPRSGPVQIEVTYRIACQDARSFYDLMLKVQLSRQRNGAYGWSIARDIADPELWVERFHCPTWLDYLRARDRSTPADRALQDAVLALHRGNMPPTLRRLLERPFGSVRWKEETVDPGLRELPPTG